MALLKLVEPLMLPAQMKPHVERVNNEASDHHPEDGGRDVLPLHIALSASDSAAARMAFSSPMLMSCSRFFCFRLLSTFRSVGR